MRIFALAASAFLASAVRVVQQEEEGTPNFGPYQFQPLPDPITFLTQDEPMLLPQLNASKGKPLVINIRETAKRVRSNWYTWEVVRHGDTTYPQPMVLGKVRSTAAYLENNMNFRQDKDGEPLFRMRQWNRLTNKPVFHVYAPKQSSAVIPGESDVFYTIQKRYQWSFGAKDTKVAGPDRSKKRRHYQTLAIYKGRCVRSNCKNPIYTADGQKGKDWIFFKNDGVSPDGNIKTMPRQVATMKREDKVLTSRGFDELFSFTTEDDKTDVGVLLSAIVMSDLHQNSREAGQWRVNWKWNAITNVAGNNMFAR